MEYPPPFLAFVSHFNRGEYRACVEPLEELWFAQRDDFHKGLIRLVVGLNQIGLGLDSGPRFLLATARELLQPYQPRHHGLDLLALDEWIASWQAGLDQPAASSPMTAFRIVLDPAPTAGVLHEPHKE
jgi:predicted metal-dependent hydrolase